MVDKLARAIADRDGGLVFEWNTLTLGEYLERWLNDSVGDSVKRRTLGNYEYAVRLHLVPM